MKLLTTKEQYKAMVEILMIKDAIISSDERMKLKAIKNLSKLASIIGGMKESEINFEREE